MVSRVLSHKRRRDLLHRKGALAALLAIVAIGVSAYGSMASIAIDLQRSRDRYYAHYQVADFWVDLKRAPAWVVPEVQAFDNVSDARGRVSLSVRVRLQSEQEPIVGQAISMPVPRRPVLNDLLPRSGSWFSHADAREVILNHAFAQAHHLRPGDRIRVLLLDKEHELLIVGTAMSPEFVYLIPSSGGLAPDPARFAVMYLPDRFLREAGDLDGAWNQIVGRARDRRRPAIERTLNRIEERLDAYGVLNTTPYQEQISIRFLADELQGLQTSATILPLIFLGVAALVLNVLLGRMVAQQRGIIGTLKALGYDNRALVTHYLGYGLIIGVIGGALGGALGYLLQIGLAALYRQFYALPEIDATFHPLILGQGLIISVIFALLGTISGIRRALKLQPAVAMRPPSPEKGSHILPERIRPLWRRLNFGAKMMLRSVFRSPYRSGVSIVASIIATGLIIAALANNDALDYLMTYEFSMTTHEDIRVVLRDPVDLEAVQEILRLPGVTTVEPQLSVVSDLVHGENARRIGVLGLPSNNELYTPLNKADQPIDIPESGLVLSRKLAEILQIQPGETLAFRPLVGQRREVRATVTAVVDTYLGLSAYANIEYLSRLIGERKSANLLLAKVTGKRPSPQLLDELNRRPEVIGISERLRSFQQLEDTFGQTMGIMLTIMILFAGLIAFGSVLNAALVSLSEREREVGTLRVLGYNPTQVSWIFSSESLLLNFIGILIGILAGIALSHALSAAYNTELYRFPTVIYPSRLIFGAILMLIFILVAQLIIHRMIHRLPWLEVLKVKE